LTQIERHQARIRRIHARHQKTGRPQSEDVPTAPKAHHVIGKSQNHPESIPLFLRNNAGDPAIKVMASVLNFQNPDIFASGLCTETEGPYTPTH